MYIDKIITFNKDDQEADLIVSDGINKVMCYACPINDVQINQKVSSIYGFDCGVIERTNESKFEITKCQDYYAYSLVGKIICKKNGHVRVGKLEIYIDKLIPNDIQEGEFIFFNVTRLDL